MQAIEVLKLIEKGEDSYVQFKENAHNELSIAQEMIAFANTNGGIILIGVDDKNWEPKGLKKEDLHRLTNLLVNAAQQHIKPSIYITTETVEIDNKFIMIVKVPKGIAIPYKDKDGIIWAKNGANKRKVTSNEEIARLLQSSGYLSAEEKIIEHSNIMDDLDFDKFIRFYKEQYNEEIELDKIDKYISNLRLGSNNKLNIAGGLLFGKNV